MEKRLSITLFILGFMTGLITLQNNVRAQTEGFVVKTPTQVIADNAEGLVKHLTEDVQKNHKDAVPTDLLCSAKCMLFIPEVDIDEVRKDFEGTGLLSCLKINSDDLTPPLYYEINGLISFYEEKGSVVVFVTDEKGIKSILVNSIELTSDNSEPGKVGGKTEFKPTNSFVSFAKQSGGDKNVEGYDLSGSSLVYANTDTFDQYQQTMVPVEILLHSEEIPPDLRGFEQAVKDYRSVCK